MDHNTLLNYPDFNEDFKIHTDSRVLELWVVISQKRKLIAFYSRNFTDDQERYTVTEKDMLSIVQTLKVFRTRLIGQNLTIYTDHKNLTCINLNTDIVLRWRLILEEYGPDIEYFKDGENMVADALSKLPLNRNQETTQEYT